MHRTEHSSLRQGLVGAWCPSLGASGLSLIDRSGRGNHGTLTGSITASDGGTALDLTSTQFALVGSATRIYTNLTQVSWSAWFRFRTFVGAYGSLLVTDAVNNFQLNPLIKLNGKLAVYCGTNASNSNYDGTGAFTLSANVWYHLACVFNGGVELTGYVNGMLDATVSSPISSLTATSSSVRIGLLSSSTRGLNCQLDDIRIYNRVLTLPEIRLLASRRGIGLTPLPDRAAGLPRKMSVIDGDAIRKHGDLYVKTETDWRLGIPSVNTEAGVWK